MPGVILRNLESKKDIKIEATVLSGGLFCLLLSVINLACIRNIQNFSFAETILFTKIRKQFS